jgi:hypothetical protein
MPRIPVYEQTQEQVTNLPSPSINPVMPNAGEAISSAVSGVMNAISRAREEADQFRAQDAINKLNLADNELLFGGADNGSGGDQPAGSMSGVALQVAQAASGGQREIGALNYKGEAALNRGEGNKPLSQDYSARYQAKVNEIAGTLGNDNQRRQFLLNAERMRARFDERVRSHEMQQGEAYKENVYKGSVAVENERAARYYDNPVELQGAMGRIVEETTRYATSKGMSKDATKALVLEAQSNMHSIVINRLLEEQKPLAAKAYFDAHRDAIDAKDTSLAIKAVGVVGIDAEVSVYVDGLVKGEFGPKGNDDTPFQIDKMSSEIRTKYKNNPQARDAALKMVKDIKQEWDAGVVERKTSYNESEIMVTARAIFEANKPAKDTGVFDVAKAIKDIENDPKLKNKPEQIRKAKELLNQYVSAWGTTAKQRETERRGKIWDAVNSGKGLRFVQQMKEFKELDGTDQRTLTNQIENELKPPAASAASKEEIKEIRDANYFEVTRDTTRVAAMTEDEIVALTPDLGRANVMKVITEKRRLAKDAETVTIDKDQLYQRAKKAGINVDNPSKKEKALLGDLWKRSEEIIYATQRGATRPIDRKEKENIYDTLLLEVPVRMQQQGGLFGSGSISYENKRVFEVKDIRNVGRPGDRDKVIKKYKDAGVEPNEDQILRGISALNKK